MRLRSIVRGVGERAEITKWGASVEKGVASIDGKRSQRSP
jgi:hypothetical protein